MLTKVEGDLMAEMVNDFIARIKTGHLVVEAVEYAPVGENGESDWSKITFIIRPNHDHGSIR